MPSFAIVIPNLNQSHFLSCALESLRFQSASFNLAVMDGGSTDNFNEVVDRYSDLISFARSSPDEGQAAAIKEGKETVPGDIVAWLNADDYYFPRALDKVAACFDEDPDLDVVYGNAIHVNPEGFFLSYFPPIREFDAKELTKNCFICQPACFVRRSAYEKTGGIDPSLHYTMDWDLWCKLSSNGAKFRYLPRVLAAVRYYHGTKTLSGDKKRYREIYRIEKKYGNRLLRISRLGAFYYGLTFKKEKTIPENIFFILFSILRKLKKKYHKIFEQNHPSNSLIYGFHRWNPVVEGICTIHIPWYDKRMWCRLRLRVEPEKETYHIKVNGTPCSNIIFENGYLVAEIPKLENPYRQISVECPDKKRWRLLEFACDLEKPG